MLTVVVLPAPFEPSRAKISPGRTSKSTPFKTSLSLKDFFNAFTEIATFAHTYLLLLKVPFERRLLYYLLSLTNILYYLVLNEKYN